MTQVVRSQHSTAENNAAEQHSTTLRHPPAAGTAAGVAFLLHRDGLEDSPSPTAAKAKPWPASSAPPALCCALAPLPGAPAGCIRPAMGVSAARLTLLPDLTGPATDAASGAAVFGAAADVGVGAAAGVALPAFIWMLPVLGAGLGCTAGDACCCWMLGAAAGDAVGPAGAGALAFCGACLLVAGSGERLGDLGGRPAVAGAGLRRRGDAAGCLEAAARGDTGAASVMVGSGAAMLGLVRAAGVGDLRLDRSKRKPAEPGCGPEEPAGAADVVAAALGEEGSLLRERVLRLGLCAGMAAASGLPPWALACCLAYTGLARVILPPGAGAAAGAAGAWAGAGAALAGRAGAGAGWDGNCGVAPQPGVVEGLPPGPAVGWKEKEDTGPPGVVCGAGLRLCVGCCGRPKLKDTAWPADGAGEACVALAGTAAGVGLPCVAGVGAS
jgi:hypothetical protein